jgi:riboflavin transporter 2
MWCELPIMVHELPEGWRLPSILGVLIQFSQTAAFLFVIFRFYYGERASLATVIYVILAIGVLSCLPLAYLWQKTAQVGAERRSIALYFFTFTLGILGSF